MAEDQGSVLGGAATLASPTPIPPTPAPPKPPIDLSSTYTTPHSGPVTKGAPEDKSHIEIETPKPVKPPYSLPVDNPEKQPTQTAAIPHTFWDRVKDFSGLPSDQYFAKYKEDDAKTHDAVQKALGAIIPFYKQASEAQAEIEKTTAGKQVSEFAQEQIAHPEYLAMGAGVEGPSGEFRGAVAGIGKKIAELPGAQTVKSAGEPLGANEFVYHATDKSRAESIRSEGLRANTWYAKTPQDAMRSGATPISGNRHDLRVFAVPASEIKPTTPDVADIGAREVEKGRFLQSSEAHKPSHEVTGEGHIVEELRPKAGPVAEPKAELKVDEPREIPNHEYENAGAEQGVQFRGIQKGIEGAHPGLAIFQDPQSGTSVAVRLDQWSPEKLKDHVDAARERMKSK
jgi:hypothetical protein